MPTGAGFVPNTDELLLDADAVPAELTVTLFDPENFISDELKTSRESGRRCETSSPWKQAYYWNLSSSQTVLVLV